MVDKTVRPINATAPTPSIVVADSLRRTGVQYPRFEVRFVDFAEKTPEDPRRRQTVRDEKLNTERWATVRVSSSQC